MELLKLDQVSYQYGKAEEPALKEITCTFERGRLYCVTGESGAGKSTLLSMAIAGRRGKQSRSEAYGLLARVGIDRGKADRKAGKLAHEQKQCVIVVTHSPRAAAYADKVLVLQGGCLM